MSSTKATRQLFTMSQQRNDQIIMAHTPMDELDEKKVEDFGIEDVAQENTHVQLKSELDSLPIAKSAWIFRKTVLICAIAGFCAATDGYQNTLSASIIANAGFKKQFGGLVKGKYVIPAPHVSTWGGLFRCVFSSASFTFHV
jgi:hypothetical protein